MPKTPLEAAVRWTGERFEADEMPPFLRHALGAGAVAFDCHNIGLTTAAGPVSVAPGDWLIQSATDGLGAVTDADFHANYEVVD
jgi:hypothetical protein